jgi:phosphohistidine phosphatase
MKTASDSELKSLILIRHAKSSWENFDVPDFERPLNDRGRKDAPTMAARMVKAGIKPDILLVSTAKRTRKTAGFFQDAWQLPNDQVRYLDQLYLASPGGFRQIIAELGTEFRTIAIISHNNGLTDFANQLTDTRIDNIPTCGIFAVRAKISDWKEFDQAEKEFWFFDYPKKI